jgi:hypothetical protein
VKRLAIAAAVAATAAAGALAATGPNPATDAALDGCVRSSPALLVQNAPEWAFVGDNALDVSAPPPAPVWVKGTLPAPKGIRFFAVHPARADLPVTHESYDVVMNILPDPGYRHLLGTGNLAGGEEETGRLKAELEQAAYPAFAWPEQGDRVEMLGNWIWDCGHWTPAGERTELHPFRGIWVARKASARSPYAEAEGDLLITTQATVAGRQEACAHRTRGDAPAFKPCVAAEPDWQSVNGDYEFTLRAPPKPSPAATLRVRTVDAGSLAAPPVRVTPTATGATVSVSVSAPAGKKVVIAKQIFVGWAPLPAAALPVHLRLTFRELLVRRAMDPGCPLSSPTGCGSVETTLPGQLTRAPGEWALYSDVAGIWASWAPPVLRVNDGQVVPLQRSVDLYVGRKAPWRLLVWARECDFGTLGASALTAALAPCPKNVELGDRNGDDSPGTVVDQYRLPAASIGVHRSNAKLAGSTCPPANAQGCYQVTYAVERIDDAEARARARR